MSAQPRAIACLKLSVELPRIDEACGQLIHIVVTHNKNYWCRHSAAELTDKE